VSILDVVVGDHHCSICIRVTISIADGAKYDLFKSGHVEFMTIPAGASAKHALLKVTGETEQMGERANDLWIRRVHVEGSGWMEMISPSRLVTQHLVMQRTT